MVKCKTDTGDVMQHACTRASMLRSLVLVNYWCMQNAGVSGKWGTPVMRIEQMFCVVLLGLGVGVELS